MWLRLFSFVILLVGAASQQTRAETWRIASLEWPPYSGSALQDGGLAVQALRAALGRADIDLVVDYMPWTRAHAIAKSPAYVGYFPAWPEEVLEGFAPSLPVSQSVVGAVMNADADLNWSNVEDLFDRHRIGFVGSYVYPIEIQREILEHYQVEDGAENEHDLARVLAAGRVDVVLTDPNVLRFVAAELSIKSRDYKVHVFHEHPLVMAFTKRAGFAEKRDLLNNLLTIQAPITVCCHQAEPGSNISAN